MVRGGRAFQRGPCDGPQGLQRESLKREIHKISQCGDCQWDMDSGIVLQRRAEKIKMETKKKILGKTLYTERNSSVEILFYPRHVLNL